MKRNIFIVASFFLALFVSTLLCTSCSDDETLDYPVTLEQTIWEGDMITGGGKKRVMMQFFTKEEGVLRWPGSTVYSSKYFRYTLDRKILTLSEASGWDGYYTIIHYDGNRFKLMVYHGSETIFDMQRKEYR